MIAPGKLPYELYLTREAQEAPLMMLLTGQTPYVQSLS